MYCLMRLTPWLSMIYRMKSSSLVMYEKTSHSLKTPWWITVSLLKVKQVLDLEIWKVGKEQASQGEALLKLIWDRTDPLNLILPK